MKTVGILAATPIADDPRVRRQIRMFQSAGWRVRAYGLSGGKSAIDFDGLFVPPQPNTAASRIREKIRLASLSTIARISDATTCALYRLTDHFSRAVTADAHRFAPDLWIANDWNTLPAAARLAQRTGAALLYDSHEFALEEFRESWKWRWFVRPLVAAVEGRYIRDAALVTTVSASIGDALRRAYDLDVTPLTVRNIPYFERHAPAPSSGTIKVLYHGLVKPNRGLETIVKSVSLWPAHFSLIIRGPADPAYVAHLKRLADSANVRERVAIEPPAAMLDLVSEASKADIGIFIVPPHSKQNEYVLPNKIFEYMMAGLAICSIDMPEIRRFIDRHACGTLIANNTPQAVADALLPFDGPELNRFKEASLRAANVENFESEADRLMASVSKALASRNIATDPFGIVVKGI
jgi:glycosyltransferase involved in cell wall biosynthesis